MYSPKKTEEQIKRAAARSGFMPVYHSVDEVCGFNEYAEILVDKKSNKLARTLSESDKRWIRNERMVCKWDFRYWCTHYHHIFDPMTNEYVRMVPNAAQEIMIDIFADCEERNIPIRLQNLKARRLGITTLMEAAAQHRAMFHPNTRAVVGSSTPDKSGDMIMMVEDSMKLHPWYMLPEVTGYNTGEVIRFGKIGSEINIKHGAMKTDIARGKTPTFAHLSECFEWAHPDQDIDAALMVAMLPSPHTFIALESTAGVIGDWWNKLWRYNTSHYGNLNSPERLTPIFLPWYVGRDIYPTPAELRSRPVPSGWEPATLTKQHAQKAKEYVANSPILSKHFPPGWTMPIEQMWYWEYTRNYYKESGELNTFLRELCSNDIECFSSRYSSVFDAEVIMNYSNSASEPIIVYGLDGPDDEIRRELKPDYREIDRNLQPRVIDKRYTLYPMKKTGYPSMFNSDGKILIYELPEKNNMYGFGVDTSKGMGQDSSAIEGIRKATVDKVARQVAEFASPYISAADLAPWVHSLARIYSVPDQEGEVRQPKLAIETNNGGDAAQLAMRKMGWSNFHQWIRLDKKILREDKANFIGFTMVEWARDLVVNGLIKTLKDGLIDIDSPWLLQEMSHLEKNEEKARIEAAPNAHDDRFMAMGMILMSLHAMNWDTIKSVYGKSKVQRVDEEEERLERVYPVQPVAPVRQLDAPDDFPSQYLWQPDFSWQGTAPKFERSW